MFRQKKVHDNINEPSATDADTTTKSKKRKRSDTCTDSNTLRKKLIILKLDPRLLSIIPTATTDDTTTSLESPNIRSNKRRGYPKRSRLMPSYSTDPTATLNDSVPSAERSNPPSKTPRSFSTTTPIKPSNSTQLRDSASSNQEHDQNCAPTITDLPQCAKPIAQCTRVEKVHSSGTLQITPCSRCFTSRKQCVKDDSSKSCSWCLHTRKRCEGSIELGKWTDVDGKRVISK